MLRLSDALAGWMPAEGTRAPDPLVLLDAGWSEIVGDDVAQNSRPTRIADGTLTITTRSSAWSHQLSFLSEHVLHAVEARLPGAGVERLRFRVGRLFQPRPLAQAQPKTNRMLQPTRASRGTTGSVGETLARFRGEVDRQRRARQARGWVECQDCGVQQPAGGALCAACADARRQRLEATTARLLYEAPWLGFAGTAALVDGLQEREYERIRSRLLAHWWGMLVLARSAGRLTRDGRERLVASSYVLLQSRLAPEVILPATVRNILGDELHDLLYGESDEGRSARH